MQTIEFLNYFHFVLSHAFALAEMLSPRWDDDFHLEAVRLGQIGL